jgi:dihydrodipicolinate synthase/N-acetylneuraminate lyase
MLLEGLQLPLTTPFYSDGRLNLRKLERNVAAYSKTPVAGIAVLSRQGEPTMLSDEETRLVLRTAMEAAAPEKVMLAGASRDSVLGTLAVADYAASLAYDAVLVEPPTFIQTGNSARQTRELLNYFQSVADRSAIPVVLYSATQPLPWEMVVELAAHPRIIGLVDGNSAPERIAQLKQATAAIRHEATVTSIFAAVTKRMLARRETATMLSAASLTGGGAALGVAPPASALKTRTKVVGFQILAGGTATMLDALLAGAVGAMPAFAACAPQACYEVFAAWKDEDRGLADEKQARLLAAAKYLEDGVGVAGIKFGCDLNGYFGGVPRLPLLPPGGEDRTEIESLLQGLRN